MGSLAWILGKKQLVGRCVHPWRVQVLPRQDQDAQVSSLGGNSPVVRERLDQRPPAAPSTHMLQWVQALVPSVPASVL